jgi:hypothetical protein
MYKTDPYTVGSDYDVVFQHNSGLLLWSGNLCLKSTLSSGHLSHAECKDYVPTLVLVNKLFGGYQDTVC